VQNIYILLTAKKGNLKIFYLAKPGICQASASSRLLFCLIFSSSIFNKDLALLKDTQIKYNFIYCTVNIFLQ